METMQVEHLEKQIWKWFDANYPLRSMIGSWQDAEFHCYRDAPLVLRMFPVFETLEYNISNGGWRQVLWNCFGCWRTLLDVAQEGYVLIKADIFAEAVDDLRVLCMQEENECEHLLSQEEWHFGEYTGRCLKDQTYCEEVFWGVNEYSTIETPDEICRRWLHKNKKEVCEALTGR